jgi:hypothetical protein
MTNNDQNTLIAKACGWSWKLIPRYIQDDLGNGWERDGDEWEITTPKGAKYHRIDWIDGIPNYVENLNSIYEAEEILLVDMGDRHEYHRQLVLLTENKEDNMWKHNWNFIHCSAAIKAEALLKTLDLWVK